ncbi:MAG: H(+)/Cl(-) exchange transporter ClcA [Syntrophothermus sp.]
MPATVEVHTDHTNSFSVHSNQLAKSYDHFVYFLFKSVLAGIAAGAVAVAFRLALTNAETWRESVLRWAHSVPGWGWLVLPVLGAAAVAVAGWLTDFAPETAGSGIPHVEAVLSRKRKLIWQRVIPVKFLAGTLSLGAGLSLGREGPTVQMGAAAGQATSNLLRQSRVEELQLIACGAGAGLSAIFNAPLAGVIFVVEELRRNFSPYVLGGALAASIAADIVSRAILGPLPTFRVAQLQPLPLTTLPFFLLLGALTGLLGAAFNESLMSSLNWADRFAGFPRWLKASLVAFLAGLVGYVLPQVLGGGHSLVMLLLKEQSGFNVAWLFVLFSAKFLLTMVSYSTGVPGGIFLPLLTLGALLGSLVGQASSPFFPMIRGFVPSFAIVGMAAYFVAVVRAPLTGIVLITEMTGRYQHMLPLLMTSIIAYVVAEALGSLPVYESLLERLPKVSRSSKPSSSLWGGTAVMEMVVESGSAASGRLIKDLTLPPDCLLVGVRRGSQEIIPRGNTRLLEGDVLRVMVVEDRITTVREEFAKITSCKITR